MISNIIHEPKAADAWSALWLPAIDILDAKLLVDYPNLCRRQVEKCMLCGTWPGNVTLHLERAHHEQVPLLEAILLRFHQPHKAKETTFARLLKSAFGYKGLHGAGQTPV